MKPIAFFINIIRNPKKLGVFSYSSKDIRGQLENEILNNKVNQETIINLKKTVANQIIIIQKLNKKVKAKENLDIKKSE